MRLYTVSDLHVDYAENLGWVRSLSGEDYSGDRLILAGDITDDMELLRSVLSGFAATFKSVHFVPGNHELWIDRGDYACSLEKFEAVLELCRELDVHVDPYHDERLSVLPLFSWYDFSFGEPGVYLRRAWRDFRACEWPEHLADTGELSEYFLEKNLANLQVENELVVSFSHFLPRIDVMPDRIPEKRRKVYPVLGSMKLGEQVRQLKPDIHIYGHSHVNQQIELEGTTYINNAYAYPKEDRIARKALHCVAEL
ncbi:MAG: metallophosphoesterase [Proteobacteria bacterium]|nr:metallophosphoesterase [Pseudomonadota bacterium]MDA0929197.1 metallophosphoesterase [Pseudomonadota bacterium]